ncbi:glycerate kinase [Thermoflavimicrobium dichotomicum]|uniref:Glycerate kinase n=1 Tax=Thermoflavimicrobium dichotomicum TaxID=46223 RepID=A0A1I3JMP8_9BACL|nr:glycerate kinase [Thermoflavimicrobium dichotomicum]SFI61446.1 glycerate kinase [Thermoflavimicrobium dichotomicum]
MRIVIAPDSYKGSLSAKEVGITVMKAFSSVMSDATISVVPMADGGEGTVDALVYATNGKIKPMKVLGPLLDPVDSYFGVLGDEQTAVVEVANIAGLTMVPKEKRNPLQTSTYGLGQMMQMILEQGYRRIIIGLGGSATNDGGLGMLQALGARFYNQEGEPVRPIGAELAEIKTVDFGSLDPRLKECELLVACDVTNPLCGEKGASYVFGMQKGATPKQVELLDQWLQQYAHLVETNVGKSFQHHPGAGAAGGLGFALLLLGARIQSGAQMVAQATGLEEKIRQADWVITGEGKTDFQTYYGKLPMYVASLAKKHGVKALLLSGSVDSGCDQLYEYFVSLHSIMRRPMPLEQAMDEVKELLFDSARNLARLIALTV